MSVDPFLGEIQAFAFGFAPRGWAVCNGQLLAINQNQALFSLLGTTYGGNGVTTFALPDLQGRAPVHVGNGVVLGQVAGEETHTLLTSEIPAHNHQLSYSKNSTSSKPVNAVWGTAQSPVYSTSSNAVMSADALTKSGGTQPHQNMQPYLVLTYCIAVNGIYPSQN